MVVEHSYQILTTPEQWQVIEPITKQLGRALPKAGSGVVSLETDAQGPASFIILQDATFAEMVWARDSHANLRTTWNMSLDFLRHVAGESARRELVTMVENSKTGDKIGSALEALGCDPLPWKLYRRTF